MREGGATVFTSEDETRRITAGFLQSARHSGPEQIDQVAGILQRSWERFAQQEKMRVTAPFRRIALGNGLVIFTQSAEMHAAGQLQHYINYAVTDGPRVGTLIFEGFGKASEASKDIEPQVLGVRLVLRSN